MMSAADVLNTFKYIRRSMLLQENMLHRDSQIISMMSQTACLNEMYYFSNFDAHWGLFLIEHSNTHYDIALAVKYSSFSHVVM